MRREVGPMSNLHARIQKVSFGGGSRSKVYVKQNLTPKIEEVETQLQKFYVGCISLFD